MSIAENRTHEEMMEDMDNFDAMIAEQSKLEHKLLVKDLIALGFKKNSIEALSTVDDLYFRVLPNGMEVEVSYLSGHGYLFPKGCEELHKAAPLVFNGIGQLKCFISSFSD